MAQLWGGRFTKETDKLVYNFNASICAGYPGKHRTCDNASKAGNFDKRGEREHH